MCYNTNECGCSLFQTLFNANRCGNASCCGWYNTGCNVNRGCGCMGNQTIVTGVSANACGCNQQVFTLPIHGRIVFQVGTGNRTGCGNIGYTPWDTCDLYYARQYGLLPYGTTRTCSYTNTNNE